MKFMSMGVSLEPDILYRRKKKFCKRDLKRTIDFQGRTLFSMQTESLTIRLEQRVDIHFQYMYLQEGRKFKHGHCHTRNEMSRDANILASCNMGSG